MKEWQAICLKSGATGITGFLLLFAFSGLPAGEIFKCVDEQGKVRFQDTRCENKEDSAQRLVLDDDQDELIPLVYEGRPGVDAQAGANDQDVEREMVEPADPMTLKPYELLGVNLIRNSSFDQGIEDWVVPIGISWLEKGGKLDSGVIRIEAANPPDDRYIHETKMTQCVPLPQGRKFRIGADFRHTKYPESSHANRLRLYWHEDIDCSGRAQYGWHVEPRSIRGWQSLESSDMTPMLNAQAAEIMIVQNGRHSDGNAAYWDNIRLEVSEIHEKTLQPKQPESASSITRSIGENYLENSGFDENLEGWKPGYWASSHASNDGDEKKGAIRVVASSDSGGRGAGAFSQCVNFGSNSRFDAGISFRRDRGSTASGGGRFRVTWYELENCRGRARTREHDDPAEGYAWQKLELKGIKPEPGARRVIVSAIQSVDGPGKSVVYWDDAYFRATDVTVSRIQD